MPHPTSPSAASARVFRREDFLAFTGFPPHADGFSWNQVEEFRLEDGVWQPYRAGQLLPGPGLRVRVEIEPSALFASPRSWTVATALVEMRADADGPRRHSGRMVVVRERGEELLPQVKSGLGWMRWVKLDMAAYGPDDVDAFLDEKNKAGCHRLINSLSGDADPSEEDEGSAGECEYPRGGLVLCLHADLAESRALAAVLARMDRSVASQDGVIYLFHVTRAQSLREGPLVRLLDPPPVRPPVLPDPLILDFSDPASC